VSPDGDAIQASLIGGPFYGTVSLNSDGTFHYHPSQNFVGVDTFTYAWSDVASTGATSAEGLQSAFSKITINVGARAPLAADDAFTFGFDQGPPFTGNVLSNDSNPEGGSLTATQLGSPYHGSLSLLPNGTFQYTPDQNFAGTDKFTYMAHGGV